jgi:hypothetical protein
VCGLQIPADAFAMPESMDIVKKIDEDPALGPVCVCVQKKLKKIRKEKNKEKIRLMDPFLLPRPHPTHTHTHTTTHTRIPPTPALPRRHAPYHTQPVLKPASDRTDLAQWQVSLFCLSPNGRSLSFVYLLSPLVFFFQKIRKSTRRPC